MSTQAFTSSESLPPGALQASDQTTQTEDDGGSTSPGQRSFTTDEAPSTQYKLSITKVDELENNQRASGISCADLVRSFLALGEEYYGYKGTERKFDKADTEKLAAILRNDDIIGVQATFAQAISEGIFSAGDFPRWPPGEDIVTMDDSRVPPSNDLQTKSASWMYSTPTPPSQASMANNSERESDLPA